MLVSATGQRLPNILLVVADQMTPFLLQACGHAGARTRHLAALGERGVSFTAAYTPSPICVPARAGLMTGQQVSRLGCYDNGDPFPSYVPTFAHYLTNAGYDVVLSGKMHFIGADQLHGFRRRLTTDVYPAGFLWSYPLPAEGEAPAFDFVRQYQAQNIGADWSTELQYDEETHFRAIEYLRQAPRDRPFALTVSYTNPHPPYRVPAAYWELYREAEMPLPRYPADLEAHYSDFDRALIRWHGLDRKSIRAPEHLLAMRRGFAALSHYIDDKLGELLAVVEERGLAGDTVVVFTSDHGDMLGEKGLIQKRSFYEWSARIPLFIARPGGTAATVDTPVSLLDLAPTLLALAGVEPAGPLDGRSLLPALEGQLLDDRPVVAEYHGEGIMRPCVMVRHGDWKYIYVHRSPPQLFNLASDPGEWRNRAGDPAAAEVERALHDVVAGGRFDLARIEAEAWARLPQKQVVNQAMARNRTNWDYRVDVDPATQYVRS
jgi:choline-sulfatase